MRKKARKLARRGQCDVYWGSHGCRKQRGHLGRHLCDPGCPSVDVDGNTSGGLKYELHGDDVALYRTRTESATPGGTEHG